MAHSLSIADAHTLFSVESKFGAIWLGALGRGWHQVYERYDQEKAVMVLVRRRDESFKAIVLRKEICERVSWWIETFVSRESA
jgi:hypothetical protein